MNKNWSHRKNNKFGSGNNKNLLIAFVFLAALTLLVSYILTRQQKLSGPSDTQKQTTFEIPPEDQHTLGQIFTFDIEVNNIESPINAIQADLSFDPNILEVVMISTKDSFANIFIQNEYNNHEGWLKLAGGISNPGFSGPNGTFGTVYFKSKKPGVTEVKYLSTSLVLANDGKGSNMLDVLPSSQYLILTETVSEQERIIQENNLPEN